MVLFELWLFESLVLCSLELVALFGLFELCLFELFELFWLCFVSLCCFGLCLVFCVRVGSCFSPTSARFDR